jgi:hypothetical protein
MNRIIDTTIIAGLFVVVNFVAGYAYSSAINAATLAMLK